MKAITTAIQLPNWRFFGLVLFTMLVTACSSSDDSNPTDDDPDPTEPENKSSGFIFVGLTSSDTYLAKYVEELPTGTLDLSDGTDYTNFYPTEIYDNALFMQRPDGASGFSKIVVNADGELEEEGILATIEESSFALAIRDSETGIFHDRATPNTISVFNPTTMEVTGTIDMNDAYVPGDIPQRYQEFYIRGDDAFGIVRGSQGEDFNTIVMHHFSLASNSYVDYTERQGNGVSPIDFFEYVGGHVTDSQNNLYILDAGNTEGQGVPARINKIPVGSTEVDPDYTFEPAVILNPENVFLPMTYHLYVLENSTKAIAVVNTETPQEAVDIVLEAGGLQNLSEDQINQIFYILYTTQSARWCELDLVAETVTPIEGIPDVGVFAIGNIFENEGSFYIPVNTPTEQAYYQWNPETGAASKAFDVTGANISSAFNIATNN
ncbi:hypothetical protein [Flagellimonas aurea]|uniref:hypothetical protein n=1 Tax=Flagellimonas aurea TaxID=2915619 RepID=UPI0035D0E6DC